MRRFIVVLLITVCLGSAQASVGQVVDSVIQSSKSVVTTATEKGKESVRFVDTSSNFKNIYSDIKAGLIGLAAGLKVGVEHVYMVLVKQQVAKAITYTIFNVIVFVIMMVVWYIFAKSKDQEDWWAVPAILTLGFIILFASTLNIIVTGFVNPEYGAITDIVGFVQRAQGN